MKLWRFLTSIATIYLAIGILLIIAGQMQWLHYVSPNVFKENSAWNPVVKTVGAALVGSGVFTAIIKSKEYSELFSGILGEIVWSRKYIEKRKDKKAIWKMVSRLVYDEKFPAISDEIEEIIASQYFPVAHNYYIENYQFIINLCDNTNDPSNFWTQREVIELIVKPINDKARIVYSIATSIDLPNTTLAGNPDLTNYNVETVFINDIRRTEAVPPCTTEGTQFKHKFDVTLEHENDYRIQVEREKVVFKATNPDKRFFAKNIIKDLKITVIMASNMNYSFHKMGTIKEYTYGGEQVNNGVKMVTWQYDGVILPHQGFILLFK